MSPLHAADAKHIEFDIFEAPIPQGQVTFAVTFPEAFTGKPIVKTEVSGPSGTQMILSRAQRDTITATGFTCELESASPDSTHVLIVQALLKS